MSWKVTHVKEGMWAFRWWRIGATFHTEKGWAALIVSWRPKPFVLDWCGGIVGINVLGLILDRPPLWTGWAALGSFGFRLCLRGPRA